MYEKRDTEADLEQDVAYALSQSSLRPKGGISACGSTARKLVEYLKLCRWKFEREPPAEMHGSSKPKVGQIELF